MVTRPVLTLSETDEAAIAKWRKTSQMDKEDIFILVMAVVIFLVLILVALVSLQASPSDAVSRDRDVSPEQRHAELRMKPNARNAQHARIGPILADPPKPLLALGNPLAYKSKPSL